VKLPSLIDNCAVAFYLADITRDGVVDIFDQLQISSFIIALPSDV